MKRLIISAIFIVSSSYAQSVNPLLERYRAMAVAYAPDLRAAQKNITISQQFEAMARADKAPKLSGDANFGYTGNPMQLTSERLSFKGQNMQYGASLSLIQPIYTGGRLKSTLELARLQNSQAQNRSHYVRSVVSYQTEVQYWNSVARAELVGIAQDFCNSISSLVGSIRERVQAGLVDPQELLMAEVKLNEAQYQLLQAQSNLQTSVMALNSLIGTDLDAQTQIEQTVAAINSADSMLHLSGTTRSEIKIAQGNIKMAETSLKLGDSKYLPQFYVGVDGSYSSPGFNFNPNLDFNYALYTKISIPILEWGKRHNDKRAAHQQIGIENDKLQALQDDVDLEVSSARVALGQAVERVNLAENSLAKARQNEQKAVERYNEGKISTLEVIDAQVYRQTSQINYTGAKAAAQGYKSELTKALNLLN